MKLLGIGSKKKKSQKEVVLHSTVKWYNQLLAAGSDGRYKLAWVQKASG